MFGESIIPRRPLEHNPQKPRMLFARAFGTQEPFSMLLTVVRSQKDAAFASAFVRQRTTIVSSMCISEVFSVLQVFV